jgi:ABC-type long-subunit fatty acid transport system fused permease/ATPase subunit
MNPSIRKPIGIFAILGIIATWAVLVGSFSATISALPFWGQIPVYLVAGIIWIAPLKPLLSWMETGKFRNSKHSLD